jgi:septal ring factor EnvC (AmiA/AmiB activator)
MSKFLYLSLIMTFTVITLSACGISADAHNAVVVEKEVAQASIAQLEKDKEAGQASIAQLEKDKGAGQASIAQLEKENETSRASIAQFRASIAQLEKENETSRASIAQLKKSKEASQASTAQLEKDKEIIQANLTKAEETVQNLNAVHPPRRFKDRNEIEAWLSNDDISEREFASSAEGWLSKALEQQARALEDGYIVSAEYTGPDEDNLYTIWLSAVVDNMDYFAWDPELDEVFFVSNTNDLPSFSEY